MGLITTVVLLFLNLISAQVMGWWVSSVIEIFALYVLMGLGIAVFYAEKTCHRLVWRAHLAYWALSLINVVWLYYITRAGGWFFVLLVINIIAMLRALSRLDAQSAGITYPVTFEGRHDPHANDAASPAASPVDQSQGSSDNLCPRQEGLFASLANSVAPSRVFESGDRQVVLEDRPEVQVELETYKEGENAVPIVRNSSKYGRDIDALMKRVKADLKKERVPRKQARKAGNRRKPSKRGRPRKRR